MLKGTPTLRLRDIAHRRGEVRDGLTVSYPVSGQRREGQRRRLNTERQVSATALFTPLAETLVEKGGGVSCENNSPLNCSGVSFLSPSVSQPWSLVTDEHARNVCPQEYKSQRLFSIHV